VSEVNIGMGWGTYGRSSLHNARRTSIGKFRRPKRDYDISVTENVSVAEML
jgi:hypothetical protein